MKKIKPFEPQKDKYTIVDNAIFDYIMPQLKPNAWKVLCFVLRKTRGWHKEWDEISYAQILKGTGIGSSATLSSAITQLLKDNYIKQVKGDQWDTATYALNTTLEIEVENGLALETEVDVTLETEAGSTLESEDTKQREKQKETKRTPPTGAEPPPEPLPKQLTPSQAMFSALAVLCQIDYEVCSDKQRGALNYNEGQLRNKKKASPADLELFGKWWNTNDWRGKKGDAPKPHQVREEWGKFTTWAKGRDSPDWATEDLPVEKPVFAR